MSLLLLLVLLAIGAIIYIGVTLEASELRVITHYSAYGIQHFYRDQWVYLLGFIAFVLISLVFGVGIAIKLLRQDREALALLVGWVNIGLIVIALITYSRVSNFI